MKLKWGMLVVIALGAAAMVGQAAAATNCGANTGVAATGAPNIVGGIQADGAPGDWSSSTDSAAARAAARLVNDDKAVALVGNGSFIEMAVNAKTYADAGIMVMASACAISECFDSSNIVSTNQGPLPSDLGAAQ